MNPRLQVSNGGLALIKRFEGYRRRAARLADGRWTIGHGHTRSAREGAEVGEADADALLRYDLAEITRALHALIFTPLTQNQLDALASFAFNIGLDNFRTSSVLRRINEGALLQAACVLEMWRKADFDGERIVIDALVRRRAAEKALFLTPANGFVPTPTPVVQPKLDFGVAAAAPKAAPTELAAALDGDKADAVRVEVPEAAPTTAETPTASQAAAAGVSARLEALINDLEKAPQSPPPPPAIDIAPRVAPSEPRPFGSFDAESSPSPAPGLRPEPLIPAAPITTPDRKPAGWSIFDTGPSEPARAGVVPLAVLGVIGLAAFAGAVFWIFNAKPSHGLISSTTIGLLIGVISIACVASSVYFLLERLGGREE
jgi:lysozyme